MPRNTTLSATLTAALACLSLTPSSLRGDSNLPWVELRSPHFTVASDAGERQARKIAEQFELFRATLQGALQLRRVDPGQPLVIIAAKNENTMKEFLPEEYSVKGHIHHAGLYQGGGEKNYVLVKLDEEGDNPYHTVYHEYMHAILHLNFDDLPLWLDEGIAEFYGNSVLHEKEARVGQIDPGHLYILQQNRLIPIDVLLGVDHKSPFYNEANRASVFYAESWALVHFLVLDKQARDHQLLAKFLDVFARTHDQLRAAREAFGDLKAFGDVLNRYARQSGFYTGTLKPPTDLLSQDYRTRGLSPAEALSLRGDFCTHKNELGQAEPLLKQALQLEPNLPVIHENLGMYYYYKQDLLNAQREIAEALRLGAADFIAFYLNGTLLMQNGTSEHNSAATESFQKAIELNSQFGPAYEGLAQSLGHDSATRKNAVMAAVKAVQLEPSSRPYRYNLAYLILSDGRSDEAQKIAEGLLQAARTPQDEADARNLLSSVAQYRQAIRSASAAEQMSQATEGFPKKLTVRGDPVDSNSGTRAGTTLGPNDLVGVEGKIVDADCSDSPELSITLDVHGPVSFHVSDFRLLQVRVISGSRAINLADCKQFIGRQTKFWFYPTGEKSSAGEIARIDFF
ncbi:MAG: hypothetical protein NVS9B4_09240 [Candidatus Acidiferrum sp.]